MLLFVAENIENENTARDDMVYSILSPNVKFACMLPFEILSVPCYLFVLGSVLSSKSLRSAPNNYALLFVLILNAFIVAVHIPSTMNVYYTGTVPIQSELYCTLWRLINFAFWTSGTIIMAWATIERYMLIFHQRVFAIAWRNVCFHYAPPIIIIIYVMSFYIYVILFYPCQSYFDYGSLVCAFPCYIYYRNIALVEYILHYIMSILCIIGFSIGLLTHVVYSRRRLQQSVEWRKYRKMILQAASVSSLFIASTLPFCIVNLFSLSGASEWTIPALDFCNYWAHIGPFGLPFVFIITLPDIGRKFKNAAKHLAGRATAVTPAIPYTHD